MTTANPGDGRESGFPGLPGLEAANEAFPDDVPSARGRIPADTLANRLMLARALAGHLSIREAADLCGLGRGAWTKWERGTRPADVLEIVPIIAERLDVDEQWLLWGGPLEGPKGRPVRRTQAERRGRDTGQYATVPVRPMSGRPMSRGPKGRTDRRTPKTGRPVIVCEPAAEIGNVLADAG